MTLFLEFKRDTGEVNYVWSQPCFRQIRKIFFWKSWLYRFLAKITKGAMIDAAIDQRITSLVSLGAANKFISKRSQNEVEHSIICRRDCPLQVCLLGSSACGRRTEALRLFEQFFGTQSGHGLVPGRRVRFYKLSLSRIFNQRKPLLALLEQFGPQLGENIERLIACQTVGCAPSENQRDANSVITFTVREKSGHHAFQSRPRNKAGCNLRGQCLELAVVEHFFTE
jgi:hypothetical protein